MNIAFIGDLTVDKYPEKGMIRLGGSSTNCAIWAARLGANASILGAVGDDEEGKKARQTYIEQRVNESLLQTVPGKSSSIDIFVDEKGEKRYGAWDPGVLVDYHLGDEERTFLRGQNTIHLTVYGATSHLFDEFLDLRSVVSPSTILSIDVSDMSELNRDMTYITRALPIVDFLFISLNTQTDTQLISTLKDLAIPARARIIVTLAQEGSLVFAGKTVYKQKAKKVDAVDATGAGDAYIAGFLTSYIKNHDIQDAMKRGTDLASNVITQLGTY